MLSTIKSVAIQVNIRFKKQIDENTIIDVLCGCADAKPWISHIHSLITELPSQHLKKLVNEYGLKKKQLYSVCSIMPDSYANECVAKIDDLAIPA